MDLLCHIERVMASELYRSWRLLLAPDAQARCNWLNKSPMHCCHTWLQARQLALAKVQCKSATICTMRAHLAISKVIGWNKRATPHNGLEYNWPNKSPMHQYPGTPYLKDNLNSIKGQYFRKSTSQTQRVCRIGDQYSQTVPLLY